MKEDENELKKIIQASFEGQKKNYVIIISTDIDDFVAKARKIKAPNDDFVCSDEKIRNRLFELGL